MSERGEIKGLKKLSNWKGTSRKAFDQGIPNNHISKAMRRTANRLKLRTELYEIAVKAQTKITNGMNKPGSNKAR